MQSRLTGKSIVTSQGLIVSRKLMSLVLQKERDEMLNIPLPPDEPRVEIAARQEAVATRCASVRVDAAENSNSRASASAGKSQEQAVDTLVPQSPTIMLGDSDIRPFLTTLRKS